MLPVMKGKDLVALLETMWKGSAHRVPFHFDIYGSAHRVPQMVISGSAHRVP